jgi:type II secretory pathway component PulF
MVGGIFVALGFLLRAVQRGVFWTRGLQNLAMRAPAVGAALRTVAEAQVAWMLHLLLNVELDIRGIIPLALRSTRSDFYTRHTEQIVADVDGGDSLYAAFARSGAFRDDFLRQLEVAEESGRLVESLGPMADRYEQQARLAFQIFTVGGGFSVWALVILILIVMIFRVASFYFGTINDLVDLQ